MEEFKDIKLIASDLDNTLLLEDGSLPEEFFELINELYNYGVIFAPASGRPYSSLLEMFAPIKDKIIFMADNGGNIVEDGRSLFVSELGKDEIKRFLDFTAENTDGVSILFSPTACYMNEKDRSYSSTLENFIKEITFVDDLTQVNDTFNKYTVYFPTSSSFSNFDRLYQPEFDKDYYITTGDDHFIDIMAKDINKGTAIKKIGEYLNIGPEQMMAFGDHMNDKEMLENVFYSYAVENATKRLKPFARFKTLSNKEKGVLLKMKQVLDKKKEES